MRFSPSRKCCTNCNIPDRFCVSVTDDPIFTEITTVIDYETSQPSQVPTLSPMYSNIWNAVINWPWILCNTNTFNGYNPSLPITLSGGWYSGLTYYNSCSYNDNWTSHNGFFGVPCNWTGDDDYYFILYMPESSSGSHYPYTSVHLLSYIHRDVTVTYNGSAQSENIWIYSGSIVWHINPDETPHACTTFTCEGVPWCEDRTSEIYIQGFGYNPSFFQATNTCPTIQHITYSTSLGVPWTFCAAVDYGLLSCSSTTGRSIIEMVDCDELHDTYGSLFKFGGYGGRGGSGGDVAGYSSDSPYLTLNYSGVGVDGVEGSNPPNRLKGFKGSAGVQLSAYGYDEITGNIGNLSGLATVKAGFIAAKPTGSKVISGLAAYSVTVKPVASGNGTLSGTGEAVVTGVYLDTGGVNVFGGIATCSSAATLTDFPYLASGQLTLSGVASFKIGYGVQGTGQLTLNGIATPKTGATVRGAGRLIANGVGSNAGSVNYLPSGRLLSSGINFVNTQTSGQLTFSGIATCSGGVQDYVYTTTTTWTAPATMTIKVQCYGAGGNGGSGVSLRGGGTGGDYARKNSFSVTNGVTYDIHIGSSGDATWFGDGSLVLAAAGLPPAISSLYTTLGDVTYTGGARGQTTGKGVISGGGGGGGASDIGNGLAGSGTDPFAGGATKAGSVSPNYDGGAGGAGRGVGEGNADNGSSPGGGGGAAGTGSTNGTGGSGKVILTY